MSFLTSIPAAVLVHDLCDYCRRQFGRGPSSPAVCPSCGLENLRQPAARIPESAMLAGAPEMAVRPRPRKKPRSRR